MILVFCSRWPPLSFQIKQLTRDWRTTAYALKYSDVLEMNEDGRKVRRSTPVPVFPSENLPSRMLLVYDISPAQDRRPPDDGQENGEVREKVMEHLLKAFVQFGAILSVRILKPGRDLPADVKKFSGRYSPVGTQECAIVEFEEVDDAVKAHESFCVAEKAAMKVILIGTKPPKKKVAKEKNAEKNSAKDPGKSRSMNRRVEELQDVGEDLSANSSSDPDSDPASPRPRRSSSSNRLSPSAYPNHHLSPNVSPRSSPWNSPSSLRKTSRMSPLAEHARALLGTSPEASKWPADYSSDSSITPSSSPWVQRRRQARTLAQEKAPAGRPEPSVKIAAPAGLPVGVLRLPRGPDGTKGFHNSHERSNVAKNV
ncbi:PREDICTED: la-related protein 6 [Thamnophis sirtalis]|uniref:La-related protein 6 n=1 Tax=Thamnophis sirtalis TaxID=35019 RepID=A0A6I9XC07_9SAUR|nr:PREDICTED: la-related protein 6 [Thamnophis sirtalis]